MATRPVKLIYQGKRDEHFVGVPMRDLDEHDIAKLSDDRLKEIMGGKRPLYVEPKTAKSESAPEKKADDKKP